MDDPVNLERLWDFEVQYRFYRHEEGGRPNGPPREGWRCDWVYAGDDISKTGMYMIWPVFVNADGETLPTGTLVSDTGTARMWILSHEMRVNVHRNRISVGVKGYFIEGGQKVAEAIVTRVLGLHTNGNGR